MEEKCPCGGRKVITEYTLVCSSCGIEQFGMMLPIWNLKRGKLRKKCYDSLPLLATVLLETPVPSLTEHEKANALRMFDDVDRAYSRDEPFCSYLYVLEYILKKIGRVDVVAFLNKIQCPKRREKYKLRLDSILGGNSGSIIDKLGVPFECTLTLHPQ